MRRRLNVSKANLLDASENEVLRRSLGVVFEASGCGCDWVCSSGGCTVSVGCSACSACSAAAMACRVNCC